MTILKKKGNTLNPVSILGLLHYNFWIDKTVPRLYRADQISTQWLLSLNNFWKFVKISILPPNWSYSEDGKSQGIVPVYLGIKTVDTFYQQLYRQEFQAGPIFKKINEMNLKSTQKFLL